MSDIASLCTQVNTVASLSFQFKNLKKWGAIAPAFLFHCPCRAEMVKKYFRELLKVSDSGELHDIISEFVSVTMLLIIMCTS